MFINVDLRSFSFSILFNINWINISLKNISESWDNGPLSFSHVRQNQNRGYYTLYIYIYIYIYLWEHFP